MTAMLHTMFRRTAIQSNGWHRLSLADCAMLLSVLVLVTLAGVSAFSG